MPRVATVGITLSICSCRGLPNQRDQYCLYRGRTHRRYRGPHAFHHCKRSQYECCCARRCYFLAQFYCLQAVRRALIGTRAPCSASRRRLRMSGSSSKMRDRQAPSQMEFFYQGERLLEASLASMAGSVPTRQEGCSSAQLSNCGNDSYTSAETHVATYCVRFG